MAREPKNSARRAVAAERRIDALALRKRGATYDEIGKALGITRQSAHALVKTAMDDLREQASDGAAEVMVLELERLDRMFAGLYPDAANGNVQAVNAVLRIMERRARMLGLDAVDGNSSGATITVQVGWPEADPANQPTPIVVDGSPWRDAV